MDIVYVLVPLLAVAAIVAFFFKMRKKESSLDSSIPPNPVFSMDDAGKKKHAEPQGDQELYRLGIEHVSDKPIMYALTTCQHCRNTRKFLDESKAEYTCIYLDEFNTDQRHDLMEIVRTYNPRGTFPTILFPNGKVIVGYRRQLLQEALDGTGQAS